MVVISAAVEGVVDEAVVKSLIFHVGAQVGPVHGKRGKPSLRAGINGYNRAARYQPWIVLVDLDNEANCAPDLCHTWLSIKSPKLCFRVAVRQVEAWLLADRENIARFLSVSQSRVPIDPETEVNPKQTMVNLAAHSRRKNIREDMVPRLGSGRQVGPAYTSRLIEFITAHPRGGRPEVASGHSKSLSSCVRCLARLINRSSSQD